MFIRTAIASLAFAASFSASAAPEWVALGESMADSTYVDRASIRQEGQFIDVAVLRNFDETITLGNDADSGAAMYQHQSVKVAYAIDCGSRMLALTEWKMFAGALGSGDVIWSDETSEKYFTPASDAESRALVDSVCAARTAGR